MHTDTPLQRMPFIGKLLLAPLENRTPSAMPPQVIASANTDIEGETREPVALISTQGKPVRLRRP